MPIARFPLRPIAAGAVSTAVLLSILGWVATTLFSDLQQLLPSELRLRELAGNLGMLDELSEASTLAAATTGESSAIARHDEAEDKIDIELAELIAIDPGIAKTPAFVETMDADRVLDVMERDAFDLVRLHELAEARAILVGDAYQTQQARASHALTALSADLAVRADERFQKQRVHLGVAVGAAALAFLVLVAIWVRLAVLLRSYIRDLADRNAMLEERVTVATAVAQLAADVAHELNTPASVIAANLEFIRGEIGADIFDEAEIGTATAEAGVAVSRMTEIIHEMRRLTGADAAHVSSRGLYARAPNANPSSATALQSKPWPFSVVALNRASGAQSDSLKMRT